ncbi:MAG: DUF456 domain-containing protein [Pseudomonadota bacterium]
METEIFLLWLAVAALVLTGLAGTVLPVLPGVSLVFAGLWLAAWIEHYEKVSGFIVILLGVLTLLAMGVDVLATALGAKRVGASRQAILGAMLGTFFGLFFGILGLLFGPFAGAVIGEFIARGGWQRATAVGLGTWLGLLFGALAKIALSLTMLGVFALAYFI